MSKPTSTGTEPSEKEQPSGCREGCFSVRNVACTPLPSPLHTGSRGSCCPKGPHEKPSTEVPGINAGTNHEDKGGPWPQGRQGEKPEAPRPHYGHQTSKRSPGELGPKTLPLPMRERDRLSLAHLCAGVLSPARRWRTPQWFSITPSLSSQSPSYRMARCCYLQIPAVGGPPPDPCYHGFSSPK